MVEQVKKNHQDIYKTNVVFQNLVYWAKVQYAGINF